MSSYRRQNNQVTEPVIDYHKPFEDQIDTYTITTLHSNEQPNHENLDLKPKIRGNEKFEEFPSALDAKPFAYKNAKVYGWQKRIGIKIQKIEVEIRTEKSKVE